VRRGRIPVGMDSGVRHHQEELVIRLDLMVYNDAYGLNTP
jgi:hypothetical protein